MNPENMERNPVGPANNEQFDAKGNPRKQYEMSEGDMFYGSEQEHIEELQKRREEAKS